MSHLAKLQVGTPFLLRQVINGKEHMQICLVWLQLDPKDPAASCLKWREQESSTEKAYEVRIGNIVSVEESNAHRGEDDIGSLSLTFLALGKTQTMELIVASQEDFKTWLEGLRFVVEGNRRTPSSPATQSRSAANTKAVVPKRAAKNTSVATTSAESIDSATADLLQRCQLQAELISELRQENVMLNGMLKQKDDAIAQLSRELRSGGTKTERCNKTELTSRESDDHLKDRETAILKRKNQRLKKLVQKKQKTITNLMQALQSALGNQTSDGDMLKTEDEGDDVDSDDDINASMNSPARAQALAGSMNSTSAPADLASDGSGSDDIMMNEEVRALAAKLEFMERAVAGLHLPENAPPQASPPATSSKTAATAFQPPPRAAAPAQPQKASPTAQQRQQMAKAPPQDMGAFDFAAVGGMPPTLSNGGMSKASSAALGALAREMKMLEEKKRTVEELARDLEPPSDNEDEDDGFPLQ